MKIGLCGHPLAPDQRPQSKYCRQCQNQRHGARAATAEAHELTFIGVDGEGVTDGFGRHKYVLLGVGNKRTENPNGLDWEQIFSHLWRCFLERPDAVYAGFFLGYDFAQWFKTWPEDKARELFTTEGKTYRMALAKSRRPESHYPVPVCIAGKERLWFVDGIGERVVRISGDRGRQKRWLYINDSGPLFQASLLSVIDPAKWPEGSICTPEEFELIKEGKERRGGSILDDRDRYYNELENDILSRLLSRYNAGLVAQGIRLGRDRWYGPGQCANEWLKGLNKRIAPCSIATEDMQNALGKMWDICIESYFAGWFEIMVHGLVRGRSYEYDINSAYPAIMEKLPCLVHGKWREGKGRDFPTRPGRYTLVRALVYGSNQYVGAMLHRSAEGNRLARPQNTGGVYWWFEIQAAKRAGLIDRVSIEEWWEYVPARCDYPLRDIRRLYDHRLSIGKDSAEGKACKLIYNSAYGKFAQSVGSPTFANPFYASIITAGCREKILHAIATHPRGVSNVLMVATDAVFFLDEHNGLPRSNKLGEWSMETKDNLTLFKPGHYWDDKARAAIADGKAPHFKARGVNARGFAAKIAELDAQFVQWDSFAGTQPENVFLDFRDGSFLYFNNPSAGKYIPRRLPQNFLEWPRTRYTLGFSMVTIGQALQWNAWERCGEVATETVVGPIKSDPVAKRDYRDRRNRRTYQSIGVRGGIYRSYPYTFAFRRDRWKPNKPEINGFCSYELRNTPYERRFGLEREDAWQNEFGLSPDGPLDMLVNEALGLGKLRDG